MALSTIPPEASLDFVERFSSLLTLPEVGALVQPRGSLSVLLPPPPAGYNSLLS